MECSNGAVKTAFDIQVDGKHGLERPEMTWQQLAEREIAESGRCRISILMIHTWRSGMRSALHTTNQLLEGGPLMDVPLYLHINQKSNDDDDEEQHDWQRW